VDAVIKRFVCNCAIQDVIQATRMLPYIGGRTNTSAALSMLRDVVLKPENGDRISVRNLVVLVANGESTLRADQVAGHVMHRLVTMFE